MAIANADGSIVIRVDVDSKKAIQNVSAMESHFERIGDKITRIGRLIGSAFAVQQLVKFGKAAIELGSDLAEVQNVVDVVFGDLNREINNFAKNAVTQFGLSELSAKQFTSTMGAMLKSMGFGAREAADMGKAITGLAGDMASFYNLDPAEAFFKIRSGISGETEPLKQLGINLSVANLEQYALTQGITKSYKAMTQQEQALLRYNYLLAVTSDAQGDFARTSDSWANQTRILSEQFNSLKASIGSGLISAFTPVLRWINTIIAGLQTVATTFRQVMGLLFGKSASSGAGAVQKSVSQVAGGFGAAADGAQSLAEGVGAAAAGAQELAKSTAAARKEAEKAILPFDTLTILHDNSTGSGGGGGKGGGISTGGVGGIDLGDLGPDAAPIEDTISPQIQAIADRILFYLQPLKEINFDPLKESLAWLKDAFSALGDTIGSALEWTWFHVLAPLATWAIEDYAPGSVDLFASALGALNDILIAVKPYGQWLWNEFLQPIAQWAGDEISDKLEYLAGRLEKIGDWAKDHKDIVTAMAKALTYFATGILAVYGAVKIWNTIAGVAAALTANFGAAIAFLTSPAGIAALVVAAIAGITYLTGHFELFKQGIGEILGGIVDIFIAVFTLDIPGILKGVIRVFQGVWDLLGNIVLGLWDLLSKAAVGIWELLKDVAQGTWDILVVAAKGIWDALSSLVQKIGVILGDVVSIFVAAFTFDIPGVLKGFCRFFAGIGDIIWSSAKSIADGVANAFDWMVQKLHDALVWVFGETYDTPIDKLEEEGYFEDAKTGAYIKADDWFKYGEDVYNMPDVAIISPEEIQKMMAEWLEQQKIDGWTYDYENDEYINNSDRGKTMSGADGRRLLNFQNGENQPTVQDGKIDGSPLKVEFASGDVEASLSNLDGMLEEGTQTAKTAEEANRKLSENLAAYQDKMDGLGTSVSDATDRLIGSNTNMITAMNNAAALIASSVASASRTPFVPHMPYMPRLANLPIPHLAKGTVIPPRAPFLAMLGDQQRGTNVETPVKVIEDAVAKVVGSRELLAEMKEQNALMRDVIYMLANIDDAKIGKMANRYNRGLDRAYGR